MTVNAIATAARTRKTEAALDLAAPEDGFDAIAPANVSPLMAWLGSAESAGVTGREFEVDGGRVGLVWDKGARCESADLVPVVAELLAAGKNPEPVYEPRTGRVRYA